MTLPITGSRTFGIFEFNTMLCAVRKLQMTAKKFDCIQF